MRGGAGGGVPLFAGGRYKHKTTRKLTSDVITQHSLDLQPRKDPDFAVIILFES